MTAGEPIIIGSAVKAITFLNNLHLHSLIVDRPFPGTGNLLCAANCKAADKCKQQRESEEGFIHNQ